MSGYGSVIPIKFYYLINRLCVLLFIIVHILPRRDKFTIVQYILYLYRLMYNIYLQKDRYINL